MSTPSSLTVVYPPSFQNSFWSYPSYRPGAHSLYAKLQAGLDENQSILTFVAHRAELEYSHAEALATPHTPPSFAAPLFKQAAGILSEVIDASSSASRGFAANTSATSRAFRMIQAETNTTHANAHGKVARHLEKSILEPFGKWAADHRDRITQSWEHVDATLARFERQKAEVDKLKHNYENKCRAADEAEDDARFAPIDETDAASPAHLIASESMLKPPAGSVLQRRSVSADSSETYGSPQEDEADPDKVKRRETIRKQFGFTQRATSATHSIPASKSEFAGVKLPPLPTETEGEAMDQVSLNNGSSLKRSGTISALVSSAVQKMPAPLKAAVGGVVSAEPRHARLRRDADNAEKLYEEAVRNLDRTRCHVEEVLFEHYGLTQRWEADRIRAVQSVLASFNQALHTQIPILHQSSTRSFKMQEGLDPSLELRALIRQARTGPFHPAIERFQPYYHDEISLGRNAGPQDVANGWLIKNGGFGLDLSFVERLEYLERLEHQHSGTVDKVASSSQLATLPPVVVALLSALDRAYADHERWAVLAKALIGPIETTDEASQSAEPDAAVIDQEKRKVWILEVPLSITHRLRDALIAHLNPSSADLIYGPGKADAADGNPIPDKLLDSYDAPILAACVKLWMLELEHSLITEDLWDQIDSIYRAAAGQEHEALAATTPTQPSTKEGQSTASAQAATLAKRPEISEEIKEKIRAGVLEDLRVVLYKLPRIHLACLDAVFSHLRNLTASTKGKEPDTVYANKLGLALGRALLRPRRESQYTVTSQIGTLVTVDLLSHYNEIFPELVEKKKKEAASAVSTSPSKAGWTNGQRPMPIRKRTKPVDQRISRSSIGSDLQQGAKILMEQMDERERSKVEQHTTPSVPSVPSEHSEKVQPALPVSIITSTDPNIESAKRRDNISAPTPLHDRLLSSQSTSQEAETVSVASDIAEAKAEAEAAATADAQMQQQQQQESEVQGKSDDKPLSNVARLSRQFNSGNLGSNSSSGAGGPSKRVSLGGVRGPRPAGARSAGMSGHYSSSSVASSGGGGSSSEDRRDENESGSK
nr:conserved hypothetical protein (N-terminal fragment) [Melanopsichium pennsylvanicum 4]